MTEVMEPAGRKWFIKGRPEYFINTLEPYVIDAFPLTVNNKVYKLENIKISGFDNLRMIDWK